MKHSKSWYMVCIHFIVICMFAHCSSGNKCVQLWVQVLEETDGDYHPVLVEDEGLVDTGGMFVLTKVCVCVHACMHHVTLKTRIYSAVTYFAM